MVMDLDFTEEEQRVIERARYKETREMHFSLIMMNKIAYNFFFFEHYPILYVISWLPWWFVGNTWSYRLLNLACTLYFLYNVSMFVFFVHIFLLFVAIFSMDAQVDDPII